MNRKTIELEVKVTMEEMKKIGEFCREEGVNFSEWMRALALREIERKAQEKKEEEKPA
ncbi:plasmid mobilization protein [Hydrogenimonas sp.]